MCKKKKYWLHINSLCTKINVLLRTEPPKHLNRVPPEQLLLLHLEPLSSSYIYCVLWQTQTWIGRINKLITTDISQEK